MGGIPQQALSDQIGLIARHPGAEEAEQSDRLVRIHHDPQVATVAATRATGGACALLLEILERLIHQRVDAGGKGNAGVDAGRCAERVAYCGYCELLGLEPALRHGSQCLSPDFSTTWVVPSALTGLRLFSRHTYSMILKSGGARL